MTAEELIFHKPSFLFYFDWVQTLGYLIFTYRQAEAGLCCCNGLSGNGLRVFALSGIMVETDGLVWRRTGCFE